MIELNAINPQAASRLTYKVQPDLTEALAVTQEPAIIWSVNGHRKYFPFSRMRWGQVTGERKGDAIELSTSMLCARVMRGMSSMANSVTPRSDSALMKSPLTPSHSRTPSNSR